MSWHVVLDTASAEHHLPYIALYIVADNASVYSIIVEHFHAVVGMLAYATVGEVAIVSAYSNVGIVLQGSYR